MNFWEQSAFLKALGWALLHSIWQMGLVWLIYITVTNAGKKLAPRQRYNIALALVSLGAFAFLATLSYQFYLANAYAVQLSGEQIALSNFARSAQWLEPGLPAVSLLYLLSILFLFVRFFRQYYFTRQLLRTGLQKVEPQLRVFLEKMKMQLNINKSVRIGISNLVHTPLTMGFWKPIILLPLAAVNHLSIQQTEAIILHELNHIRQNDYLVNLLIACLDIILFFNPFSRLFTRILMKEREHSCDDLVLQYRYAAPEYSRALLILEQSRLKAAPLLAISAIGSSEKNLLYRVQRMLTGKEPPQRTNFRMFALLFSSLLIAATGWFNPGKIIVSNIPALASHAKKTTGVKKAETSLPIVFNAIATTVPPAKKTTPKFTKETNLLLAVNHTDQLEELELVELVNAEYAAIQRYKVAEETTMAGPVNISYAGKAIARDFSIPDPAVASLPALALTDFVAEAAPQPYVPASSFSYQYVEDTSFPKKYMPTLSDRQAKEDLEITLKALESINLQKILGKLKVDSKGNTVVDLAKFQEELKIALSELNWKQISEEVNTGIKLADQEMRLKDAYVKQLQRFQEARINQQNEEEIRKKAIILDRIMQNKALQGTQQNIQTDTLVKKRKIVVI